MIIGFLRRLDSLPLLGGSPLLGQLELLVLRCEFALLLLSLLTHLFNAEMIRFAIFFYSDRSTQSLTSARAIVAPPAASLSLLVLLPLAATGPHARWNV